MVEALNFPGCMWCKVPFYYFGGTPYMLYCCHGMLCGECHPQMEYECSYCRSGCVFSRDGLSIVLQELKYQDSDWYNKRIKLAKVFLQIAIDRRQQRDLQCFTVPSMQEALLCPQSQQSDLESQVAEALDPFDFNCEHCRVPISEGYRCQRCGRVNFAMYLHTNQQTDESYDEKVKKMFGE